MKGFREVVVDEVVGLRNTQAKIEARLPGGRQPTPADLRTAIDQQQRYDPIYRDLGMFAPRPDPTESALNYKRRLLEPLMRTHERWRNISPYSLPADALAAVESEVIPTAQALVKDNNFHPPGKLRERRYKDESGRECTEYFGDPLTWMRRFTIPPRWVKRIGKRADNE